MWIPHSHLIGWPKTDTKLFRSSYSFFIFKAIVPIRRDQIFNFVKKYKSQKKVKKNIGHHKSLCYCLNNNEKVDKSATLFSHMDTPIVRYNTNIHIDRLNI